MSEADRMPLYSLHRKLIVYKRWVTMAGFFSFFFGACSKPTPPAAKPLPEITASSEGGGFVDLEFAIRSYKSLPDGSHSLEVRGIHQGREVGIVVVLGSQWKASIGTVVYRSLGAPSDALLVALDQLYGTKLQPLVMRSETTFAVMSLEGTPGDLTKGPTKMKLFYEPDGQGYAELYTNVNLQNGILQIHEKDPDYRAAIIHALRAD